MRNDFSLAQFSRFVTDHDFRGEGPVNGLGGHGGVAQIHSAPAPIAPIHLGGVDFHHAVNTWFSGGASSSLVNWAQAANTAASSAAVATGATAPTPAPVALFAVSQAPAGGSAPLVGISAGSPQSAALAAATASMKGGPLSVMDSHLAALYLQQGPQAAAMAPFTNTVRQLPGSIVQDVHGKQYVVIDATAKDGNGALLLSQLNVLGLQHGSSFGAMASGAIPISQLGALMQVADLRHVVESAATTSAGLVNTQADAAQYADAARYTFGVDGTGIKVGVLSDSFNKFASTYPDVLGGGTDRMNQDIANGDLPPGVIILQDYTGGEDEGRGMAQLIHDLAPGASILFATAFVGGQAGMANNIIALADNGAKVIVDDVSYFDELAYQDGIIAQAVSQVVNDDGVLYFTSAANNGMEGWQGSWVSGATGSIGGFSETMMKFGAGVNGKDYLTVVLGDSETFILQWDEPGASAGGAGSASDLDIELTDISGNTVYATATDFNIGGDPVEIMHVTGGAGGTFYLRVGLANGPAPTEIKVMMVGADDGADLGTTSRNTNDGTVFGHAASDDAIAVAATAYFETPAFGTTPPAVEDFSSGGPTTIWYDVMGVRLAMPEIRHNPQLTGVDGGNTTFFGSDAEGDGLPNFFGTSAAAPDVAAVAVLMLHARPELNRDDVLNLLQDSAFDMDDPTTAGFDVGFDDRTGSGLIRANLAVQFAQTLTITADPAHGGVLNGTHLSDTFWGATVGSGGSGNDTFKYNGNFLAADKLDGGLGTDGLSLNGSYIGAAKLVFTALTLQGVESVVLAGGGYDITTHDGNVAAGETLTIDGSALLGAAKLTFNGTGELNGKFVILGGAGADVLKGGAGADSFTGGLGKDTMTGGAGGDVFVFNSLADTATSTPDVINGWGAGDTINLHAIDANSVTNGNQDFHFGGGGGHAGDVVVSFDAVHNRTVINLYVNSGASIDAVIWLNGNHPLGAGDFVF